MINTRTWGARRSKEWWMGFFLLVPQNEENELLNAVPHFDVTVTASQSFL